jgi:hypothetical protein
MEVEDPPLSLEDQLPPALQFVPQLSPSSPRVGPAVRTSSSSSDSTSSCSSSFAAAAADSLESKNAPEPSAVKQRTITALFGWKAQTSTSDTPSSQNSGREQRIPAKLHLNGDYYVDQVATYRS